MESGCWGVFFITPFPWRVISNIRNKLVIATGLSMGRRPILENENDLGSASSLPGVTTLPFVIPSEPGDLQFRGPILGMFFDRAQRTSAAEQSPLSGTTLVGPYNNRMDEGFSP
jgi:hypothetical protein